MGKLVLKTNPKFEEKFSAYPTHIREKMEFLRKLVIETAEESESIDQLEETLKWGEPSFVTKHGSTLRMDWKTNTPDQYAMYLVSIFRIVFEHKFQFEGNRAIVFPLKQNIPVLELKECIKAALTYHKVKHLMTLGI